MATTDLPIVLFAQPEEWIAWLEQHHATAPGIWIRLAKKASGLTSMSYAQAVEGALCYGWIDSQMKGYDDASSLQKFTPRGPKSRWSKINTEKVAQLIASGRMQPAGLVAVERAK